MLKVNEKIRNTVTMILNIIGRMITNDCVDPVRLFDIMGFIEIVNKLLNVNVKSVNIKVWLLINICIRYGSNPHILEELLKQKYELQICKRLSDEDDESCRLMYLCYLYEVLTCSSKFFPFDNTLKLELREMELSKTLDNISDTQDIDMISLIYTVKNLLFIDLI